MAHTDDGYGYYNEGDTTGESINLQHLEHMQKIRYDDGSIEITDTLPKREYYMSLRKGPSGHSMPSDGTMRTLSQSQASLKAVDYKPSGKTVECTVIMLDGTEDVILLDKASFGQQLFNEVCERLGLLEDREFFGLTYKEDSTNVWFWLWNEKKISKQIEKGKWTFEFQVKYYPPNVDMIREDLTRYYLCLQVRQDLVSGQLPCSFNAYVLLGAYIVQSEAGDYDPLMHVGVDYIKDQPFAPTRIQTNEMLERIAELHRIHRGQTPEEADRCFLENAKKLAMYGVDMHSAKDGHGDDANVGVYHGGILVYRDRLRIHRFSWPRTTKLSYKGKTFTLIVRPNEGENVDKMLTFKCKENRLAKRLWKACVDHHSFFRLRDGEAPKKPLFLPGFATRKYKRPKPKPAGDSSEKQPAFKRKQKATDESRPDWFKTINERNRLGSQGSIDDTLGYTPVLASARNGSASHPPADQYNRELTRPDLGGDQWRMWPADCTPGLGMDTRGLDVATAPNDPSWQGCRSNKGIKAPGQYYYEGRVLEDGLARLGWSTNEASLELGTDNEGFGFGADSKGYGPKGKGRKMHRGEAENYGQAVHEGDVIGCQIDLDAGMVQWTRNGEVFGPAFTIPEQLRGEPFFPAATLQNCRVEFNFGDDPFAFYPKGPWVPVAQSSDENRVPNKYDAWGMNPYDATQALDVSPSGLRAQSQLKREWQGVRGNKGVFGGGKYYFEATPQEKGLGRIGWATEEGKLDELGCDAFGFGYGADKDGFGLNGAQGKKLHGNEIDTYGEAFTKDDVIGCMLDLNEGTVSWAKNGRLFGEAYRIPPHMLKNSTFFPAAAMKNSTVDFNFGDQEFKFYPGQDWLPLSYTPSGNTRRNRRKGPELNAHKHQLLTDQRSTDRREDVVPNSTEKMVKPKPVVASPPPKSPLNGQENNSYQLPGSPGFASTSITSNGSYTTVQKGEPEVKTETYYDENGQLVKRTTRKHVNVYQSEQRVSTKYVERKESDAVTGSAGKMTRLNVTFDEDEDDRLLNEAILSVTGMDPDTSVLDDSVGDVEIHTKRVETEI